jgi:O-antigen ligase
MTSPPLSSALQEPDADPGSLPLSGSDSGWFSRRNQLLAFSALLCVSIAFDPSVYVGGLTHLYVHDATSLLIGILGLALAVRNRVLLPGGRWFGVPTALFVFVLANTVLVGSLQYHNVPVGMQRLFWLEHGDAVRITGELFAWVWTFGQLQPTRNETWSILSIALWGTVVAVGWLVAYSIATNAPHATTSTFDVDILTGLPLAVVFVLRTQPRLADFARVVVLAAGGAMLYSRATILTVVVTTLAVLVVGRDWRRLGAALASIAAGYLIALLIPLLMFGSNALTGTAANRAASIGNSQLAPYTIPTRVEIWKDALRISLISPVIGVGYHDYFLYSRVTEIKAGSQLAPKDLFSSRIKSAHNDYLSWLSETGALGMAVFLGFWGSALMLAIRYWRREPAERVWHTFTGALIISFVGISAFGEVLIPRTPEAVPPATIWWIVLALLFIEAARERSFGRARN